MHLPVLRAFDLDLYQEFQGISRASGLDEDSLLVLNHYTDLRDLGLPEQALEEGCSILHVRDGDRVLLAQTWDMHATAEPFVMMLYLPDEEVWTLTITGCLALCGLHRGGLAVAINNLVMSDAKVGVSWPTLVRKLLRAHKVEEAQRLLRDAPVSSGHHYLICDRQSSVGWETSGSGQSLVYDGHSSPYVHTNHCLDEYFRSLSRISPTSTTQERFDQAERLLSVEPAPTAERLWDMMACRDNFPSSLFTDRSTAENPHGVATCARVLMDCSKGEIWARAAKDEDQSPKLFEWAL
jgi:isopenicillin-N N-acyltransferase-like protein